MSAPAHTNRLIHETSPYLLQHAHNPVNWMPWGDEAFSKAKEENKLVLISIGYSACHWCHVMERESFEDEEVAAVMNRDFICIKVDREERPDVDNIYMSAVQIMSGSGGWPLNCFALPDGRPIYGGTYFPKQQWMKILHALTDHYKNDSGKVLQYAEELTSAVKQAEWIPDFSDKPDFTKEVLHSCYENWQKRFDNNEGGPNRVPKFPLPNNYVFLLRYSQTLDQWARNNLLKHIDLTLTKMAFGGIYDQVGGGFARYSTDGYWKVPHFEKMLYDNAQLVSLYAEAFQLTKKPLYKQVVYETLAFLKREMTSPDGTFYSALDADSEGGEGKYYVWTQDELQSALGDDMKLFAGYFNVNEHGYWEEENYILLRKETDEEFAARNGQDIHRLQEKISELKKKILAIRERRIRPGLDNKILVSWNAMMIKGYADAFRVFREREFLDIATICADRLLKEYSNGAGRLQHAKDVNGFLEDYACTAEAYISLYQCTFEEAWLFKAKQLADFSLAHFYDEARAMFYFTSDEDKALIARKMEIQDNVTPSSNSTMAKVLFYLGRYFDSSLYTGVSIRILKQVQQDIAPYGSAYSNWAALMLHYTHPFHEIAIVGNSVDEKLKQLSERYLPNAIFVGGKTTHTQIPLLQGKFVDGKTLIYICRNRTCQAPTENVAEALDQLLQ